MGQLNIPALLQYIKLWRIIEGDGIQLQAGVEDIVSWRWSPSQTYTARSAYAMFFEGSTRFAGARPIWKAWAPLKVKFLTWLAVHKRIWTADRRRRHGLQARAACILCDQDPETADHLFVSCCFTKQVWHAICGVLNAGFTLPTAQVQMLDWWLQLRSGHNHLRQRGIDSIFMLVTWCIWKERNGRTFGSRPASNLAQIIEVIVNEGKLWVKAGAKWMAALGWPEDQSMSS